MFVCKLGFFNQKKLEQQNREVNQNLLTARLKDNSRMVCENYLSNIAKAKQKKISTRLKFNLRKRRAKKRLILRNNHRVEVLEKKAHKSKLFHRP
ncbi:MAG: hypothetical protein H0U73_02875 [Tatlockia sp.]|nr:hypothetical protein [Tatlockia sp.]